jgi:hypothetical protein
MKDRLDDPVINQGYTPFGAEKDSDEVVSHMESYEPRRFKNSKCPSDMELEGFRTFVDKFYPVTPQ